MSDADTFLSEPKSGEVVPLGTLVYFRTRNRLRLHQLLLEEFARSGISQAELARRLDKPPEVVCRTLGAAGNLRLDTVSDYLFAMSAAETAYGIDHPLQQPPRNDMGLDWMSDGPKIEVRSESASKRTDTLRIDRRAA